MKGWGDEKMSQKMRCQKVDRFCNPDCPHIKDHEKIEFSCEWGCNGGQCQPIDELPPTNTTHQPECNCILCLNRRDEDGDN